MHESIAQTAQSEMPRVSRAALFFGFLKIGLLGFGGVGPVARHVIVADRGWLSDKEYATVIGLGKVLPGANTVNAAVIIGDRFQGPLGAAVAVLGLLAMPLVILVALASLYERFSDVPDVKVALGGAAAAAAGLVIGTALKMAQGISPTRVAVVIGLLAFVAVGLLHFPLLIVVVVLAPLAIVATALERRP